MKKLIIILILFSSVNSFAVVGGSSFEFLLVGSGSRASAMGEAFTAVSGDVGAPYFNPSSAGLMSGGEISFAHLVYLEDTSLDQISAMTQSGNLRLGISVNIGSISDIERYGDNPSSEPLGIFDEHNFYTSVFWGYPVTPRLSIGNSVKFAYEKIDLGSATAIGADFGLFYTLKPQVALGASVRNIGTKPKFISRAFDLPRELRLGASYRTEKGSRFEGLLLAADYILPKWGDGSSKFNIGGEYNHENLVYFRSGYNLGYDSRSFAIGGGITYRIYYFDYAFVLFKNNLSNTHRFTMRIRL